MIHPFDQETDTDFISSIFSRVVPNRSPASNDGSCGQLDRHATHYRMDHKRRGVAAIFNQVGCGSDRGFVRSDVQSLNKTFRNLGFETETFNDLGFNEVECALETLSRRDHSDCDCFVLVYLSGGSEGKLRARDGFFDVNCLWGCFTAEKSPTLANKPKVFIIHWYKQLSRGKKGKVELSECAFIEDNEPNAFGPDRLRSYYIPDRSDFLIVLSTVQGMTNSRCRTGSLFIQTLCQNLNDLGFNEDMNSILIEVNRQLIDFDNDSLCDICKKQMPTVISLLIRILQFTDKSDASCVESKTIDLEDVDSTEDLVDQSVLDRKN